MTERAVLNHCSPRSRQEAIATQHDKPNDKIDIDAPNSEVPSREIQLFEPPEDAICTIEATAHLVDVPRRTILVYCKHRLLSPVINAADRGYSFDRDGIRALRRIEALRMVCGDDLAGIKIILDLTNELERLHSAVRFLSQTKSQRKPQNNSTRKARNDAPRKTKSRIKQRRK